MRQETVLYIGGGPRAREHNYVRQLLGMVAAGELALVPGQVTHVDVYHDHDCRALSGGVCDCEPDVRLRGDPRCN